MVNDLYCQPGMMTDLSAHQEWLGDLPDGVEELAKVVQGLLIHPHLAHLYGQKLSDERQAEVNIRSAGGMLTRIQEISNLPVTTARPPEQQLVGNCRDHTVLLTAFLRHKGIPARARCGFGTYFEKDKYIDHWVVEVWKDDRWVLVDGQIDAVQREFLKVDFDVLDVPRDRFLVGGAAWQLCRQEKANPDTFGIFDMWGLWFVRGNLIRDVAALSKVELLPWDGWGLINEEDPGEDGHRFLDEIAVLSLGSDQDFEKMRDIYEGDDRLRVPEVIISFTGAGPQNVRLRDELGVVMP